MNKPIIERTPPVIAAEINMINYQTGKIMLTNSVEIGRRLKEAKALLPHGEWGTWLEEAVNFSQSTATRLMQIYDEYGPQLLSSVSEDYKSNCASMHNLTYTQAVILLGLPAEKREEFITNHDVQNMSTRELRQSIADRDKALSTISHLTTQVQNLKHQAEDYRQDYFTDKNKAPITVRESEEAKAITSSVRQTPEAEDDLQAQRIKDSLVRYEAQFILHRDTLIKAYKKLLETITALARLDREVKEKNRQAAYELLGNLTKMLEVWPPKVTTNMDVDTSQWE